MRVAALLLLFFEISQKFTLVVVVLVIIFVCVWLVGLSSARTLKPCLLFLSCNDVSRDGTNQGFSFLEFLVFAVHKDCSLTVLQVLE